MSDCCEILYSFILGPAQLAFDGLLTPKLAAAKGELGRINTPAIIYPVIYGELYLELFLELRTTAVSTVHLRSPMGM